MGESLLLQEWTTIRGSLSSTIVTQSRCDYLDVTDYRNIMAFVEVSDASGSPTINFETSPTTDAALFQNMQGTGTVVSVGVTTRALGYTGFVPAARFLRWRVTAAGTPWSVTFRIWLSATFNARRRGTVFSVDSFVPGPPPGPALTVPRDPPGRSPALRTSVPPRSVRMSTRR